MFCVMLMYCVNRLHHSFASWKRYLERATKITETCFVSSAVTTVRKDKSEKVAFDSQKFKEVTAIKRNTNAQHGGSDITNIKKNI